jgi:2-haloacid dehalogenase
MIEDIEAVVFDVLGTLVDEPAGIERAVREHVAGLTDGEVRRVVASWLRHVEEQQQEIVAGRRAYADSTDIDREACAASLGSAVDEEAADALVAAAQRPEPWPDSVSGLGRVASRLPVMGLSNASRSAFVRLNAHAGLRWHLVLSAQDAQTYKPHPDVYRLAVIATGLAPERLLMVAAHAWDLRGAQAVGLRTAYVARPVGDPPSTKDSFDLMATSLEDLATQLVG